MPAIRVHTGGWEHDCCGPAYERYTRVSLSCVSAADGVLSVSLHHDRDDAIIELTGTVVDLFAVDAQGVEHPIDRVPSGSALTGNDPHDDALTEDPFTEAPADISERQFVLVIDGVIGAA